MKLAIQEGGPIYCGIKIYGDFFSIGSRIYSVDTRYSYQGYHAVAVTGWGESETGTKYWHAINSWGKSWGFGEGGRATRATAGSPCERLPA